MPLQQVERPATLRGATLNRLLGAALSGLGLILLGTAAAVLFAGDELGVRLAVALGVPGCLVVMVGLVVLLAEAEWLRSNMRASAPEAADGLPQPDSSKSITSGR